MIQEFVEVIQTNGERSIHPVDNLDSVKRMLSGKIQKIRKVQEEKEEAPKSKKK
jgi:hypothetical protein